MSSSAAGEGDFSAEEIARGRALRRAQWPPLLAARGTSLTLHFALGLTPAGAGLVTALARPFGGAWWAQVLLGGLALLLAQRAVALPFTARVRVVRARFGLVTQSWLAWGIDMLRALLLTAPLALGALFGVYTLASATAWWWAWTAGAAALAVIVLSWLAPLVLEPVFNRFTPMDAGPLREALLALAERDRIAVRDVLVADASRRTTALNAYVSGLGRTRRIVIYDTLLATAEPREIELVTAHELGHVKHHDVSRSTALGALSAATGVCLIALALHWQPLLDASGAPRFTDPRSMALLAAVTTLLSALVAPSGCALSRRIERRADRYALELTRDPGQFIRMQRRLTAVNVLDPDPPRLLHALFGTHPTPVQRIAAARDYEASCGASS
jgi:STE24 endopeptidase